MLLCFCTVAACAPALRAQEPLPFTERPTFIVSLMPGWIGTMSRNDFPSLIIGNSEVGSGVIPAEYADMGSGYTVELAGLLYFGEEFGLTFGFATTRYAATYGGDTALLPTSLEIQETEFLLGARLDAVSNAYREGAGFRSLFVEGGFEFGLGVTGNRVTSSAVDDTATGVRTEAIGSFEGGEPFRSRVALRVGLGTTIDLSGNRYGQGLSLIGRVGYSHALNPVFSSEVVENSSFRVDHLMAQIGLGYRF